MRYFFAVLIVFHGLISFLGFLKAFNLVELKQFEAEISKVAGVLWLLSSVFLFLASILILNRSEVFWILGSIALIISQFMIIWFWKDAKFGTVLNIILLILVVINFSMWNHNREANEKGRLLISSSKPITFVENKHLPKAVNDWMKNVGTQESDVPVSVQFSQKGRMRLSKEKPWISFSANQYVKLREPSFLWAASVGKGQNMQFSGVDQYLDGTGNMKIALYGLINIVDAKGPEINQGTAIRYLAEIVWYPWVAKSENIVWEKVSDLSCKATFSNVDLKVEGLFTFNNEGYPVKFEALRYNEEKGERILWSVEIDPKSYKKFDGVSIPSKASVIWKYDDGHFRWLEVEVLDYKTMRTQ